MRPLWFVGVIAFAACAFTTGTLCAQPDLTQPRHITIPLVEKGPVIDGKLDDACWKQASLATNFLDQERLAKTVSEQTFVWMLRDRENLYFGFKCLSKDPSKTIAEKSERDAYRAFKDDVVEIMLDTERTQNDFYHFCVNSIGAIWDAETHRLPETERMISSPQWNSTAEAKGSKDREAWYVEVRIPIKDLGGKAVQSVAAGGKWGLQLGRENWSGNELSAWSRTYAFTEPKGFGTASFTGAPVKEEPVVWKQQADKSFLTTTWPQRHRYDFARVFVFGPEADSAGAQVTIADPAGAVYVYPTIEYGVEKGYGFKGLQKPLAVTAPKTGYAYGKGYSPLVRQFIASREPAAFLFDLPKGQYRAIFTSGSHASGYYAPTDTQIEVNGVAARIENPMPFRAFNSKTVEFAADGAAPVKVAVSSSPGMSWLLNHILVYPAADEAQAAPAFESHERDFFNYPVEEKVYKTAKVWVEYPAQEETFLTEEEQKAGFAVVALPSAHFTPRNYAPQKEDSRGALRAISSPGERTTMQVGFYAIQPVGRLEARLASKLPPGVSVQLMQTKYSVRNVGAGALNQWGYQPRTLWPVEPVYQLPAARMQPYWLIVDIAEQAAPGVQTGTIEFLRDGRVVATREFRLTVLPFRAENRRFIWSMFYTPTLATPGYDAFTPQEKAVIARVERTYQRDLKRHGIDYVAGGSLRESYVKEADGRWHFRPCDREALFLNLMKECGLRQLFTGILGYEAYGSGAFILNEELQKAGVPPITSPPERYRCKDKLSPAFFENLTAITKEQIEFYQAQKFPVPAFFLWDEPGDVNSPALAPLLDAVHQAGGRTHVTLVAGCFPALEGKVDNRDYNGIAMGIAGGGIESPEKLLARKQKDGTKNFVYQNGTIMGVDPRQARFSFGYWAWAWNLDGLNPYKYWKIYGDPLVGATPFHPLQLDDPDRIKVTTVAWEMHAEGIYDNKLVQKLEDLTVGKSGPAVAAAVEFLKALKKSSAVGFSHASETTSSLTGAPVVTQHIWPACRYDLLRAQLARHILAVSGATAADALAELDAVEKDAAGREATLRARREKDLPPVRKGNLVVHGDCEGLPLTKAAPAGFTWSRNAEVQGEVVHSGQAAIRFARQAAAPNDNIRFPAVPLAPGRNYLFQGWAKRTAGGAKVSSHSGFWLHIYGPDGPTKPFSRRILVPFSSAQPDFDWRRFEYNFTAQPGEQMIVIWVYDGDADVAVYVDDVSLLELDD